MIQQTSLESYKEVMENLGERQIEVYQALKRMGQATNAMISRYLILPINCITPRIFELRKLGFVAISRIDFCQVTGRKAIYWRIVR